MNADDSAIMHLCSAKSVLYPAVMPLRSAIMAIYSAKSAYYQAVTVIGRITVYLIQHTSFPNPRQQLVVIVLKTSAGSYNCKGKVILQGGVMLKDLIELDKKHFIHPTSSIQQQQEAGSRLIIEEGDGIYLKDRNGKTSIDAMSSLWNVNIGHGRKELADAASEQMQELAYSSAFTTFSHEPAILLPEKMDSLGNVNVGHGRKEPADAASERMQNLAYSSACSTFSHGPAILLAEKIASLAPGDLNAVFFTSGGSESKDTAFKLARHYWKIQGQSKKRTVISLKRGYHGVAAGSTSATGIPEFWDMAGHMMTGFIHAKTHYQQSTEEAINSIRTLIEEQGAETIAAFIAEPVQGSGGVLIPTADYFKEIRKLCDENDILFIADEVITGFG